MNKNEQAYADWFKASGKKPHLMTLESLSAAEDKLGKGSHEFTKDEWATFFSAITHRISTMRTEKTFIKGYFSFLRSNGIITQQDYMNISLFALLPAEAKVSNNEFLFRDTQDLATCVFDCYDVLDSSWKEKMAYCARFLTICFLTWMLFDRNEISELRLSDFSEKDRTIAGRYIADDTIFNVIQSYLYFPYTVIGPKPIRRVYYVENDRFVRALSIGRTSGVVTPRALEQMMADPRKRAGALVDPVRRQKMKAISSTMILTSSVFFSIQDKLKYDPYISVPDMIQYIMLISKRPYNYCSNIYLDYRKQNNLL